MTPKLLATCLAMSTLALPALSFAADSSHGSPAIHHRYIVERSFPEGALDGLDAAQKSKVNQTNARFGVRWEMSYATSDKTKTYCIYDGPSEAAIRDAAQANHLSVDSITEVPVTLESH